MSSFDEAGGGLSRKLKTSAAASSSKRATFVARRSGFLRRGALLMLKSMPGFGTTAYDDVRFVPRRARQAAMSPRQPYAIAPTSKPAAAAVIHQR